MSKPSSKGQKIVPANDRLRKYRSKKSRKTDEIVTTIKRPVQKKSDEDEDALSKMKSAFGCPSHLLYAILRQTDLDEATIHTRYLKFRMMYPTGFVGPHVLRELCLDVLSEGECERFVTMVFRLFGHQKKGWGTKLIGFREVILATENVNQLKEPSDILQWIFRVYDTEAAGELPVRKLKDIIQQLIVLCAKVPDEDTAEEMAKKILADFEVKPYDGPLITEEEFVYDCLNNDQIFNILRKSSTKSYDSPSTSDDEVDEINITDLENADA